MAKEAIKFPSPMFQDYTCREDYEKAGVPFLTPMTALEIEDEEDQRRAFEDPDLYVEEKLDGTRGTLILYNTHCRLFSRRISKKTDWFSENTDSVPHLRDYDNCQLSINPVNLAGTVLDGEMYIPNRPFKDVSATLNCKWNEAVSRQMKLGRICIRVFDIRYYKGIKLENMPLHRRKVYLQRVVDQLSSPYVVMHPFYESRVPFTPDMWEKVQSYGEDLEHDFPELFEETFSYYEDGEDENSMSQHAYYQYIVLCGGEGVILKKKDGKYYEKRGREYQKIKKFITRDVIVIGYGEPTKEYTGKFPKDFWCFWVDDNDNPFDLLTGNVHPKASDLIADGNTPVTHYWYYKQIGTIRFGVFITDDEIAKLPKGKKFNILETHQGKIVEVGECSGFNDDTRAVFTRYRNLYNGVPEQVIEVKANEVFVDTGRLRHPRFMRLRDDKNVTECTWANHTHTSTEYVKEY